MNSFLDFLSGKKRGIAAVGGVLLTWCMKYEVAPGMYLDLAATLHGLFTAWAVGDAVMKYRAAQKEDAKASG